MKRPDSVFEELVSGAPLEREVRAFTSALEQRREVLAMVDAHRESNGAEAPLPVELRACLLVANEEALAAGEAWSRAVAAHEGLAAYTLTGKPRTLEALEDGLAAEDAMRETIAAEALGDYAPDAEELEERDRRRAEIEAARDEVGWPDDTTTSRAGGHYGDA
jgi:hypothetical protein